jgi:hypothetical protein
LKVASKSQSRIGALCLSHTDGLAHAHHKEGQQTTPPLVLSLRQESAVEPGEAPIRGQSMREGKMTRSKRLNSLNLNLLKLVLMIRVMRIIRKDPDLCSKGTGVNFSILRKISVSLSSFTVGLVLFNYCPAAPTTLERQISTEQTKKVVPPTTVNSWLLRDKTVESPQIPGLFLSQLDFIKGNRQQSYQPHDPPYGLVKVHSIDHESQQIFITSWSHGARTLLIRIFVPEKNGASPICPTQMSFEDFISYSERLDARIRNEKIEVYIMDSEEKERWQSCELNSSKLSD